MTSTVAAMITELGLSNPDFCLSCGTLFQLTPEHPVITYGGKTEGRTCSQACADACKSVHELTRR
jgi:hypothetical protein